MDRRTQNRLREHSGAGHELVERKVSVVKIGQKLFGCECGWFGWLMIGGIVMGACVFCCASGSVIVEDIGWLCVDCWEETWGNK